MRKSLLLLAALVCSVAFAQVPLHINNTEAFPHVGHIVSHNTRTGEIEIKLDDEAATGHWRLHPHVVAYDGPNKISLDDVWGRSKQVRLFVSKDGVVHRIIVLAWK